MIWSKTIQLWSEVVVMLQLLQVEMVTVKKARKKDPRYNNKLYY